MRIDNSFYFKSLLVILFIITFPVFVQSQNNTDVIKTETKNMKDSLIGTGLNVVKDGVKNFFNKISKGGKKSNSNNTTSQNTVQENASNSPVIDNSSNNSNNSASYTGGYPVTKNIYVNITGEYPKGYEPAWRLAGKTANLEIIFEDYTYSRVTPKPTNINFGILEYEGKTVLKQNAWCGCECIADIELPSGKVTLSQIPLKCNLTHFRKIPENSMADPNESCYKGMWTLNPKGYLLLSADGNGNITFDFRLEVHGGKGDLTYLIYGKNLSMPNELTPDAANESIAKAKEVIAKEKEAKQQQKDYLIKTERQADSLQKLISKKYPQAQCKDCFYSSSGSYISTSNVDQYYVATGEYAGTRTDWDLNIKTQIKNKCNYNLLFIGIQQFYDDDRGYYLKEVTKLMPSNYSYSADQGAMTSLFTSLIGGGSEFNIKVQDKYYPSYATVGAVQWIKVIKSN